MATIFDTRIQSWHSGSSLVSGIVVSPVRPSSSVTRSRSVAGFSSLIVVVSFGLAPVSDS